jgi:Fungal specific transcription factor domain
MVLIGMLGHLFRYSRFHFSRVARLLSICLGRPMGVEDSDCNCEIPLDLDDDELEAYCKEDSNHRLKPSTPSKLAGFIAFSKLCQIAGKVIHAVNPLRWQKGRRRSMTSRSSEKEKLLESLDAELFEWLNTVPDSIRFSANSMDYDSPHLTMCVILYIVHAACVINLHR